MSVWLKRAIVPGERVLTHQERSASAAAPEVMCLDHARVHQVLTGKRGHSDLLPGEKLLQVHRIRRDQLP